jgi:tetrapyrrole methylase family protein / MazG family protein
VDKEESRVAAGDFEKLLELVKKLRGPEGCPWDRSRTKEEIGRYLIGEAYEVIDAIAAGSRDGLKEELGDLLFHILFLARMAEEDGKFDIADVMTAITEKMVRRHPHVFGSATVRNIRDVKDNWDEIKKEEYRRKGITPGLLDRIPGSLPALMKAKEMTAKASQVGFDWEKTEDVLSKLEEELAELKAAITEGREDQIREETGDLLFSIVNLSRFTGVDAEESLQATNGKFAKRFAYIEAKLLGQGKTPESATLEEMDRLWNESKGR